MRKLTAVAHPRTCRIELSSPRLNAVTSSLGLVGVRVTYHATKVTDCDFSLVALWASDRDDCRSGLECNLQSGTQGTFGTSDDLRTGCAAPENGFYRVIHSQHRLPREITLLIGHSFPRCSKCAEPIYFELTRSVRFLGMNGSQFKVALYELPELTDQDDSLAA